jgi:hypothetical protein
MPFKATLGALVCALPLALAAGTAVADDFDEDLYYSDYSVDRVATVARRAPIDPLLLPTLKDDGRTILAPEGVTIALREQGFFDIRRVVYTGGVYTAVARSRSGVDRTLRIEATTGLVLRPYRRDAVYAGDASVYVEPSVPRTRIGYVDRAADRVLLTFARIRSGLEDLGYSDCNEASYRDGVFRVEARNTRGDLVRLRVDAYTGDILNERIVASFDDPWTDDYDEVGFDVVRKRLLRDRYKDIESIRVNGDIMVLKAEDRYGDEVRLTVDSRSGRIIKTDYVG